VKKYVCDFLFSYFQFWFTLDNNKTLFANRSCWVGNLHPGSLQAIRKGQRSNGGQHARIVRMCVGENFPVSEEKHLVLTICPLVKYHRSGSIPFTAPPASRHGSQCPRPVQPIRDLWWTKCHWDRLPLCFWIVPVINIPSLVHIHLCIIWRLGNGPVSGPSST
jgi:hypothetical protein